MKITNASDSVAKPSTGVITLESIQLSDLLSNGRASQYQDGVKDVVIKPGTYVTIPNLQACNSVSLKTLYDDTDWGNGGGGTRLTIDDTVEPDGTDPTNEVGGPILGLAAL